MIEKVTQLFLFKGEEDIQRQRKWH